MFQDDKSTKYQVKSPAHKPVCLLFLPSPPPPPPPPPHFFFLLVLNDFTSPTAILLHTNVSDASLYLFLICLKAVGVGCCLFVSFFFLFFLLWVCFWFTYLFILGGGGQGVFFGLFSATLPLLFLGGCLFQ